MDGYMTAFHDLWQEATSSHPFLVAVRARTITPGAFNRWLVQDLMFVRSFLPFVASLLTKQPQPSHLDTLSTVEATLRDEIAWFVERGEARGLDLSGGKEGALALAPTTAYMAFLQDVAKEADYPTHLAVYWLIEKVYQAAWSGVLDGVAEEYKEFALRWGSPEFGAFCDKLKSHASEAVGVYEGDEAAQAKLRVALKRVLELENSFWQMAMEK